MKTSLPWLGNSETGQDKEKEAEAEESRPSFHKMKTSVPGLSRIKMKKLEDDDFTSMA